MDLRQQVIPQMVAGQDGKLILSISATIFNLQLDLLESKAVPPSLLAEISYTVGSHGSSGPRFRLFRCLGPSRVDRVTDTLSVLMTICLATLMTHQMVRRICHSLSAQWLMDAHREAPSFTSSFWALQRAFEAKGNLEKREAESSASWMECGLMKQLWEAGRERRKFQHSWTPQGGNLQTTRKKNDNKEEWVFIIWQRSSKVKDLSKDKKKGQSFPEI